MILFINILIAFIGLCIFSLVLSKWMRSPKEIKRIKDIQEDAKTRPYIFQPGIGPYIFFAMLLLMSFGSIFVSMRQMDIALGLIGFGALIFVSVWLIKQLPRIELHQEFLIIESAVLHSLGFVYQKKYYFDQIQNVSKKALGPHNPFPVITIRGKDFMQKIYLQFYDSQFGLALYEILTQETKK